VKTESTILKSFRVVAVVGISANQERASYGVAKYLQENGYRIIPVNPSVKEVLGEVCYPDLLSVPDKVEIVDIFRRPEDVPQLVEQAIKIGAKAIWMQEGVVNEIGATSAKGAGLLVVMDRCMKKMHRFMIEEESV
jgi:uncharacterized protein